MDTNWDCIVVGGGAAGLNAALVLGRARRRTLLVDAGEQSNLPAEGIGGLLGHDERPPAELYDMGRAELGAYPTVEVRDGTVEAGERVDGGFALAIAGGARELTRRVILATGWSTARRTSPGCWRRCGAGRCSTARSVTAGRCGTRRSGCSAAARAVCTARCFCAGGARTWCC